MLTALPKMIFGVILWLLVVSQIKPRVEWVSLKAAHLLPVWGVVELPETVFTEVAWVLGGKIIIACHPVWPKYVAHIALSLP